jgi:predicted nucleotidyltransferase
MRKRTQQQVQGLIREMVERIVAQFSPEKVILFGSHARGKGSQ